MATLRALSAFAPLSWAYLERMAAGDAARGAVILGKLSAIYPSLRHDLVTEFETAGLALSSLPPTIPATWTGATISMVGYSIVAVSRSGTALEAAARATMEPGATPRIGMLAQGVMQATPSQFITADVATRVRSFASPISSASVSAVAGVIDRLLGDSLARPMQVGAITSSNDPRPAASPPVVPTQLPSTTIAAAPPTSAQSPMWPWFAIGGVIAVGLAVFAYQRLSSSGGGS